jgi:hypothetical protein
MPRLPAQASPYFAALFERWPHTRASGSPMSATSAASLGPATSVQAPPSPSCVLHVSSWHDVDAALQLLRCCYTGRFDAATAGVPDAEALLAPAAAALKAAAEDWGGGSRDAGHYSWHPEARGTPRQQSCWQQLAVRTLVLADQLDCAAVSESCIEALSGRLFAHQMSLDAAMTVLWLLPEALACQEVVAPLQHMAHVRVVQVQLQGGGLGQGEGHERTGEAIDAHLCALCQGLRAFSRAHG